MEPIDPLYDMLENCEEKAVYLECTLEDWPALRRMTEEEKEQVYAAIETALRALDCRVEVIRASELAMRLVVNMGMDCCIDDIMNAIDTASLSAVPHLARKDEEWIGSCCIDGLSPTDVAAAVINIGGKPPRKES